MPRAAVRSIQGLIGNNTRADVIDLHIDNHKVRVGGAITGTVKLVGYEDRRNVPLVHLEFEGLENTIVAFPQDEDNAMGVEYLKKHTTETKILIREEVEMPDCGNKPQPFRFPIPDDLPGTLRCILDGTHPTLPSQCQIKYSVTATIHNQHGGEPSSTLVSHPILVLPQKEIPNSKPIDPSIRVSAEASSLDVLFKSFFSCGNMICADTETDPIAEAKYVLLEATLQKDALYLSAGQALKLEVSDWWGQLKGRGQWMMKISEELRWKAQGRIAHSRQTWDLYANHHELPTTLRRSYEPKKPSLVSVSHELVIYLTTKDVSKEILATTEPIPVQILSSDRGWDA